MEVGDCGKTRRADWQLTEPSRNVKPSRRKTVPNTVINRGGDMTTRISRLLRWYGAQSQITTLHT